MHVQRVSKKISRKLRVEGPVPVVQPDPGLIDLPKKPHGVSRQQQSQNRGTDGPMQIARLLGQTCSA